MPRHCLATSFSKTWALYLHRYSPNGSLRDLSVVLTIQHDVYLFEVSTYVANHKCLLANASRKRTRYRSNIFIFHGTTLENSLKDGCLHKTMQKDRERHKTNAA